MTNNLFVGTWKLISCENRLENGQIVYFFGQNPIGYLMYSEDFTQMSQEEKITIAETYFAYCGKYEVLADKVIHYPESHIFPNLIGVPQERTFKITDKQLFLTAPPEKMGDMLETTHLVWERVSK